VVHVDSPVATPTPASRLTRAAADLGTDLTVTTAVTSGVPAHGICAYARAIGADLVVMGTHGRTGVARLTLGSVAEAVVRHATCPVMTIPVADTVPVEAKPRVSSAEGHCVICAGVSPDLFCKACCAIIGGGADMRKAG
jgi:hypothetical protein